LGGLGNENQISRASGSGLAGGVVDGWAIGIF
jgi:hypothetical protein